MIVPFMTPTKLSEFLKEARVKKCLTLRDVEKKSHGLITYSHVWRVELGRQFPGPKALCVLASVYGIKLEKLLKLAANELERS